MSRSATDSRDLVISRLLSAPAPALWRAWADPALLRTWWCPKPWQTEVLAFDFRAGGAFHTVMHGPDGERSDNPGCFLEVIPQQKIVMTSMLTADYRPAVSPFAMTTIINFADEQGGCRYTATVLHADDETREQHEQMGFFEGWNIVIDQLNDLALPLREYTPLPIVKRPSIREGLLHHNNLLRAINFHVAEALLAQIKRLQTAHHPALAPQQPGFALIEIAKFGA